jgi:uncharacterized protein (TIGR02217 family)
MEVINTFIGKLFGWDLRYRQEWATDLVDYDTGKEQRNQIWERPKRHWVLPYNALITTYRNKLIELCSRAKGMYDIFLFEDPYDYECALTECVITAVGGETSTQLIKTYYYDETEKWDENKTRIQPSNIFAPIVKIDNVVKTEGTHFTLDDNTGIIDWTGGSAPNGVLVTDEVVTANYRFYCPVRFDRDTYEESTIASGTWNMGDIPIVEVIE